MQQVATDHRLHGEPCCPQMPVWPKLSQPGGPVTKRGSGKREGFSVFYVWVMVWPGSLSPWPNWGPENSQFSSSRPLLRNRNHTPAAGAAPPARSVSGPGAQIGLPRPRRGDPPGPREARPCSGRSP